MVTLLFLLALAALLGAVALFVSDARERTAEIDNTDSTGSTETTAAPAEKPVKSRAPVSYTHLTLPTKRIV